MSVGFPLTRQVIDNAIGGACVALRNDFETLERLNGVINSSTKQPADNIAALVALGYSPDEAQLLSTNLAVLDLFRQVWEGKQAIASPTAIVGYISPFISTS